MATRTVGPTVRIVSPRFISVDNYHSSPFPAFCPVPEGLSSATANSAVFIYSVCPSLAVFLHTAIKCVALFKLINAALSFSLCQMTASEKDFQTTALKVRLFSSGEKSGRGSFTRKRRTDMSIQCVFSQHFTTSGPIWGVKRDYPNTSASMIIYTHARCFYFKSLVAINCTSRPNVNKPVRCLPKWALNFRAAIMSDFISTYEEARS